MVDIPNDGETPTPVIQASQEEVSYYSESEDGAPDSSLEEPELNAEKLTKKNQDDPFALKQYDPK